MWRVKSLRLAATSQKSVGYCVSSFGQDEAVGECRLFRSASTWFCASRLFDAYCFFRTNVRRNQYWIYLKRLKSGDVILINTSSLFRAFKGESFDHCFVKPSQDAQRNNLLKYSVSCQSCHCQHLPEVNKRQGIYIGRFLTISETTSASLHSWPDSIGLPARALYASRETTLFAALISLFRFIASIVRCRGWKLQFGAREGLFRIVQNTAYNISQSPMRMIDASSSTIELHFLILSSGL